MTYELSTCILKMILLYIVILSSVTIQTVKSQGDKDCDCKGFGLVKDLVLQVVMEQRMESAKLSRLEARLKTYETTWPILNDRLKGLEKNLNDINMKFNETVTGTKDKQMGFNRGIGTIVQKALISEKKERKKLVSSMNKIVNEYKDTIETFKEAINNTIDKRFQDISAEQVKYKDTVETFKVAINKTIDKRFQDITTKQADYKATIETYKEAIDNTIDNRFQDITAKQVDYKATIETYKEAINNTIDNRFQDIAAEQREYKNTLETFKVSINKTIDERFEHISANQIKYRNEISLDLITINETRYMVDTLGKIVEGGQVRLVNGSNQYEGRLEVWHDWSWGTVCGDGFDTLSASVVCKMLNFQHTFPRVYGSAQFGAGASLIHLDNVDCKGTETSITQCRHNGWGINDCEHREDVGISCTPECAKPKEVQHAFLRDEYANIETFKEGDKVEYDCDLGYMIEGITRERWCRNTRWTEVRFTCIEITCPWVLHPDNGRHLDTSYAVGDVMKFECNIGYKLKGRDAILCRIDGQWSPPEGPTCDPILCPTLPEIQHGSIFQNTSDGLANNYESVAEYTCDRAYYLNGNTQLKTVKRTCQSDGKWSGKEPICEVPKCNLIEDFYGGSVEYFGRRDLYSHAFYSCDENYSMIPSNVQHSTCENNLRWEPPPPKCFKQADIYIPNNGYLRGRKKGKVLHDESYKICCRRGFVVEKDDIVPVNKESCSDIRNNNGTLKPKVECVEVQAICEKPKPVQNAVLRDEYANIETFKEGDKVEYDCELAYTIEGITRERWCRNTRWTEVRFTCIETTCPWVPHPDNGRHLDTSYAVGDAMKFECNIGYKLKGRDTILCRIDGQWSPPQGPTCDPILCPTLPEIQHGSIFNDTSDGLANNYESVAEYTCDRGKMYIISTKTGTRRFAGTDANVYITLFGSKESTRRIDLRGKFESGDVTEIRTFARDVRPIHSVQIGHDGANILSDWDLEYVSIYVEDMEEFYVFRNIKQQWVKKENDLTLHREGNQSCINTFGERYIWYPKWRIINRFFLGKGLGMSSRACKQACIIWTKNVCNGVYYDTPRRSCYGFFETRVTYFTVQKEPWHGELFFRTCKKFN